MFPNQMIKTFVGKTVRVELKGEESTLIGKLEGVDDYMNLYLSDTVEYKNGEKIRSLGNVILRGNNIILIQPHEE